MTKQEFFNELHRRCDRLKDEFPNLSALQVYMAMIAYRFDINEARNELLSMSQKNENRSNTSNKLE